MRVIPLALALVGCGGPSSPSTTRSTPPPSGPVLTEDRGNSAEPTPEPVPAPTLASTPPTSSPPPKPPLAERLRDGSGDVAGLAGWKIVRKADPTRCTGLAIVTTRGKQTPSVEDQPLVNVYTLTFPTGLSFDPSEKNPKQREASLKKFNGFMEELALVGAKARSYYDSWFSDDKRDAQAKIIAVARLAQINMRMASLLARAEIPKDLRIGEFAAEKTQAFCERLLEVAEPMLASAEDAMNVCATQATALQVPTGWWTAVCAP